MPDLVVSNLHVWRGERHVLRSLAFSLGEGRALQLLWPNGAGKTTLLRTVAGFLHVEEGEIAWDGSTLGADRTRFNRDVAWLGHELALKGDLTAVENLAFSVGLRRAVSDARLRETLAVAGLDPRLFDETVRRLSAGQQRRVALARLALWDARLWLLDEPAANLDAAGQAFVGAAVDAHLAGGGSALIATHHPLPLAGAAGTHWAQPGAAP
jgi:heme exporter protein A